MSRLQQTALILTRDQIADMMTQLILLAESMREHDVMVMGFAQTKLSHEIFKNSGIYYKIMASMSSAVVIPPESKILKSIPNNPTFPSVEELEHYVRGTQKEISSYFQEVEGKYAEIRVYGQIGE